MTNTPLLDISNLQVEFNLKNGIVRAVDNVSFTVKRGEFLAIVGESGCGKSVTALSIMKLLPKKVASIKAEHIKFDGQDLISFSEAQMREIRGRRMSMIFQEPMTSLNPVLTIGDQLTEPLITHLEMTEEEANQRAVELLTMVGIPEPKKRLTQYPHQFSGGMRQRVMIAIGLACEPDLIIADEPTTALDVTIQAQILELLKDVCNRLGVAIIMITHNLGVVAAYADKVNVMYAARIVEKGEASDIFAKPSHPYTIGLLRSVPRMDKKRGGRLATIDGLPPNLMAPPEGCRFKSRCPMSDDTCSETPSLNAKKSNPNHSVACFFSKDALKKGAAIYVSEDKKFKPLKINRDKPLLSVRGLKQHFGVSFRSGWLSSVSGTVKAVDDVSFEVYPGETVGLVGESGCGKTSVGRAILHLNLPTGGNLEFDERNLNQNSIALVRQDMQVIFQDPFSSLNPRMTIGEILDEPLKVHKIVTNEDERVQRVSELLTKVGLYPYMRDRYPHELSGGQRQRVGIARALCMEPKLIICDEPVSALDVSVQAQIINLLEDLQRELGIAYLFIAHDLAVVKHISHKVIVMYLGKVMEIGDGETIYKSPKHPYTKALLDAAPIPDPIIERGREKIILKGELPSPLNPPSGCVFSSRCNQATDDCRKIIPELTSFGKSQSAACIKIDEVT